MITSVDIVILEGLKLYLNHCRMDQEGYAPRPCMLGKVDPL